MTMEQKSWWVKVGHRTPEPENSTYAGVVSQESVRIDLTYAALNGLNVYARDIKNSYLQIPSSEKYFIICSPEFGLENIGKRAMIIRALYGVNRAGADYWGHVWYEVYEMGFEYCKADTDIWFCSATKYNGTDKYQYVLLYKDEIMEIMQNPEDFIRHELAKNF